MVLTLASASAEYSLQMLQRPREMKISQKYVADIIISVVHDLRLI